MRKFLSAFALLALAACGAAPEKAKEAAFPATQAPTANTSIGPNGAAGITAAIPLTVEAVTAAAPHFIVETGEGQIEGDPYPFISLKLADEVVFTLYPTADRQRVNSVETRSSQSRGPRGEVIGVATFGDAQATDVMFCRSRVMHEAFDFTCSESENGRFWRAYQLPEGFEGPSEPFESLNPDSATRAKLVQMTWIAPR